MVTTAPPPARTEARNEVLSRGPSLRTPPHNIEAEKALLGAIFANNRAYERVSEFLEADHFAVPEHGRIFAASARLIERGQLANPVTLKTFFESEESLAEIGGPAYLAELAQSAVTVINAGEYGRLVYDLYLRRQLITLGEDVVNNAYSGDVSESANDQIEKAEQGLYDLAATGKYGGDFETFRASLISAIELAQMAHAREGHLSGVPTGLRDLDKKLGGQHASDLLVLAGRPSMGKAQPLDALIKTTCGWKTIGALRLGDELASIDGRPSFVRGIFPQGRKQIFRVTFSDGRAAEACAEHLWKVHYRSWPEPRILSTAGIAALQERKRYRKRLWIDHCSGHFGHREPLSIPPWVLGALLGDGSLKGSSIRFSSASLEILGRLKRSVGSDIDVIHLGRYDYRLVQTAGHRRAGRKGVWPNPLKEALLTLGLWDVGSESKFIPEMYLTADREARLALLQGLLDTDGWIERWGSIRFATSSERLADNVIELARSLGAWCTKTSKAPRYSHKGEVRSGRRSFVCNIHYADPAALFSVSEKKVRAAKAQRRKRPVIVAIEPTRVAEACCIAVTHPEKLYITNEYVVTHNTALATNIAFNAANIRKKQGEKEGAVVGFFSLEMSAEQLATRILSEQTRISSDRIRKGELSNDEFERLVEVSQTLHDLPIFIDDSPGLSVSQLRTRARRLKRQHGLGLIVIDYLQLMSPGQGTRHDSRVQEVSEITRGLKTLAKELNVPVLALSQLSRAVEQREDKRPQLADLRESGSIEQDADVVMFIYREQYYLERAEPQQRPEESLDKYAERHDKWKQHCEKVHNVSEVMVAKQRHGPIGKVQLFFEGEFTRFGDLDTEHGGADSG